MHKFEDEFYSKILSHLSPNPLQALCAFRELVVAGRYFKEKNLGYSMSKAYGFGEPEPKKAF